MEKNQQNVRLIANSHFCQFKQFQEWSWFWGHTENSKKLKTFEYENLFPLAIHASNVVKDQKLTTELQQRDTFRCEALHIDK